MMWLHFKKQVAKPSTGLGEPNAWTVLGQNTARFGTFLYLFSHHSTTLSCL